MILEKSMVDYVLEYRSSFFTINYATFLKQTLELWMLVPCKLVDGVWVVLKKPVFHGRNIEEVAIFQKAKERVLFEGIFTAKKIDDYYLIMDEEKPIWASWNNNKTIEDLLPYKLILTPAGEKELTP